MNTQPFILRWRVKDGKVLLFNRHIRELAHFDLTPALIAWVHERLEWAAANLLRSGTEAVLVLSVNPATEVQVSLEDVRSLPVIGADDLVIEEGMIAGLSLDEGVLPATVWLARHDGTLVASLKEPVLAIDTLAQQLALTQGIVVLIEPQPVTAYEEAAACCALSDEFGFIPLRGSSPVLDRLGKNLEKLFQA